MSLTLAQDIKIRDAYSDGGLEAVIAHVSTEHFQEEGRKVGWSMAIESMRHMLTEMENDYPF